MKWTIYLETWKLTIQEILSHSLIVTSFANDIFPLPKVSQHKKPKDEKYAFSNKLVHTIEEEKNINMELFQKKFKF